MMNEKANIGMFGVANIEEFVNQIKSGMAYQTSGIKAVVVSMLSDAQMEISMGITEQARQTINRAKFLLLEPDLV